MTDMFIPRDRTTITITPCRCNNACGFDSDQSDEYTVTSADSRKREPTSSTSLVSSLSNNAKRFFMKRRMNNDDDDDVNDDDDVDRVLAKEFSELTFQQRERVMDELHGVAEIPVETPDLVTKSLLALDKAIKKVPKRNRKAMEKAYFLRPSFATDTEFKLLFLRAEEFNPIKAATRMIAYFEAKKILFCKEGDGDIPLAKKQITLDDLSQDDIHFIFYVQCFGAPKPEQEYFDASGRPIMFSDMMKFDYTNYHVAIRGVWYISMSMLLPEEQYNNNLNQQALSSSSSSSLSTTKTSSSSAASVKGICDVLHLPQGSRMASSLQNFIEGVRQCVPLFVESLPYRVTSVHFCYSDPSMKVPISILQKFMGREARIRMRVHYGTPLEIRYALLPFGIKCPPNVLNMESKSSSEQQQQKKVQQEEEKGEEEDQQPLHDNNNNNNNHKINNDNTATTTASSNNNNNTTAITNHRKNTNSATSAFTTEMNLYLQHRRQLERHRAKLQRQYEIQSGILLYPNHSKDVLIGRGPSYKEHPGNQYHQELVESNLPQYIAAANNFEKTCISMNVVQTIQNAGGRFLMLLDNNGQKGWKVLETSEARDKTSNSFRSKIKNKQQQQSK